ncbi:uncharacterized protein MONBRDRAFT_34758 [Monosiga brevicollis MX1]|uniref:TPR-like protein n=1 Tax=Monosiga brevicollis TaxID=81824 RepID=A9VDV6_MONBE|nr:uncharacterized protein MONBRDRAFT_34758 [Monosiga brevicollis MX1]EDQ84269.1 predicted protein [Monosiga brevicollis MX1]|eukprot:XP_001750899.1 hypothetical protein [Monosiga brevicollis MX1]
MADVAGAAVVREADTATHQLAAAEPEPLDAAAPDDASSNVDEDNSIASHTTSDSSAIRRNMSPHMPTGAGYKVPRRVYSLDQKALSHHASALVILNRTTSGSLGSSRISISSNRDLRDMREPNSPSLPSPNHASHRYSAGSSLAAAAMTLARLQAADSDEVSISPSSSSQPSRIHSQNHSQSHSQNHSHRPSFAISSGEEVLSPGPLHSAKSAPNSPHHHNPHISHVHNFNHSLNSLDVDASTAAQAAAQAAINSTQRRPGSASNLNTPNSANASFGLTSPTPSDAAALRQSLTSPLFPGNEAHSRRSSSINSLINSGLDIITQPNSRSQTSPNPMSRTASLARQRSNVPTSTRPNIRRVGRSNTRSSDLTDANGVTATNRSRSPSPPSDQQNPNGLGDINETSTSDDSRRGSWISEQAIRRMSEDAGYLIPHHNRTSISRESSAASLTASQNRPFSSHLAGAFSATPSLPSTEEEYLAPNPPPADDDALDLLLQAQEQRHLGHFSRAISLYSSALSLGLHTPAYAVAAQLNLGLCFEAIGTFDSAEVEYRNALNLARQAKDQGLEAECYSHLGIALEALHRPTDALEAHLTAYSMASEAGLYRLQSSNASNIACALVINGHKEEASSDPVLLGKHKHGLKWHLTALEELQQACGDHLDDADIKDLQVCHCHVGIVAAEAGLYDMAVLHFSEEFELAIAHVDASLEAHQELVEVAERLVHFHIVCNAYPKAVDILDRIVTVLRPSIQESQRTLQSHSRRHRSSHSSSKRFGRSASSASNESDGATPIEASRSPEPLGTPRSQSQGALPAMSEGAAAGPGGPAPLRKGGSSNSLFDDRPTMRLLKRASKPLMRLVDHADSGNEDVQVAVSAARSHYELLADVLSNLGALHVMLQDWDKAMEAYMERRALLTALCDHGPESLEDQADVNMRLGLIALAKFDYVHATTFFKNEMEIRNLARDSAGHAVAMTNLGHALVRSGNVVGGARVQEKAFQLFSNYLNDPIGKARAHRELAAAFTAADSPDMAIEHYEAMLSILSCESAPLMEGDAHLELGAIYLSLGNPDAATHHFSTCIELAVDNHLPRLESEAFRQFGMGCELMNKLEAAIEAYRTSLYVCRENGCDATQHVVCYLSLGNALLDQYNYMTARTCFEQALSIIRQGMEADILSKAEALCGAAEASFHCLELDEAIAYYEEYLTAFEYLPFEENVALLVALTNVATACAQSGRLTEAANYLQRAFEMEQAQSSDPSGILDDWQHGFRLSLYGDILLNLGDTQAAAEPLTRARYHLQVAYSRDPEARMDYAMNLTRISKMHSILHNHERADQYTHLTEECIFEDEQFVHIPDRKPEVMPI